MSLPTTRKPRRPEHAGATSTDDFLGGCLSIIQPRKGHRAGSDAVFLAAAVAARPGERALDAGAGVGVAGLCLLARVPDIALTSVEIDEKLAALAAENAARNNFSPRCAVVAADVTARAETLLAKGIEREAYEQVIANPPFYAEGSVRPAPNAAREVAHVMQEGGLDAWVRFFATVAAPKGVLTVIHRPDALPELLPPIDRRFGAIRLFPLFAKAGAPATRMILQARKGSRESLSLLPGLVLHDADGHYTQEAEAVLRDGAALDLGD